MTWDSSKYDRMSPPRNAEPWAVVSHTGTVVETWCTRARAEERAEELSAKHAFVDADGRLRGPVYRVARAEVV